MRGMSNNTPQLNRSLSQGTQLPSHVTPTTGVPTMSLHTPPSPSRYLLITNISPGHFLLCRSISLEVVCILDIFEIINQVFVSWIVASAL